MSETENDDKTVTEETLLTEDGEYVRHQEDVPKKKIPPAVIAAAVAIGAVSLLLIIWYLSRSSGEAGRPVPAARTTISESSTETLSNQTLTLTPEQLKNAGITVETIGEQLSTDSSETSATGSVEPNAYRQTPAIALVGGIVRRVIPELGQNVSAGQTVAMIFSDEFAQTQSRYITLRTETENARRNYERSQRLVAINQPGRSELEQATKQRRAAEAALNEMRNRFERTNKLIRIGAASKEELEQDTTKLRTAEAELDEARLRETRANQLLTVSPEVRAAGEEALNKLRSSESELAATRERLILYGIPASRLDSLRSASQVMAELAVPAPISGTVTSRSVNVGEVVEANKELMRVTDLSTVWVVAEVFERDLARLRVGTGASITSDAFPDRLFRGQVTYIDPQLNETTRTGKVRIEIANPHRDLKLGMYVRAAFGALGNAERTSPVVPADAVQNLNGQQIVFVPTSDPNTFELRPVRLGTQSNGRYEVFEGLRVGDKIVTSGSFSLRAEWLKTHHG